MKTREILIEILETGKDLIELPFKTSRYNVLKIGDIKSGGKSYRTIKHLESEEFVNVSEKNGITKIEITAKGRKRALRYSLDDLEIKKPAKWDRKWRIIIFDIPDRHKNARHILQRKIRELGFVMIQKSVYIHPYECIDEIDFVRRIYNLKPFVRYILAEDIEDAKKIMIRFGKNQL